MKRPSPPTSRIAMAATESPPWFNGCPKRGELGQGLIRGTGVVCMDDDGESSTWAVLAGEVQQVGIFDSLFDFLSQVEGLLGSYFYHKIPISFCMKHLLKLQLAVLCFGFARRSWLENFRIDGPFNNMIRHRESCQLKKKGTKPLAAELNLMNRSGRSDEMPPGGRWHRHLSCIDSS